MRALFSRTVLPRGPSRLPYVLFTSPPLRSTALARKPQSQQKASAITTASRDTSLAPKALVAAFQRASAALRRGEGDRSASSVTALPKSAQKEAKRRGFQALVDWCAARQRHVHDGSAAIGQPLREADRIALAWARAITPVLSCGQALVLTGFLCAALDTMGHEQTRQRGVRHETADRGSSATQSEQDIIVEDAISLVASLVQRAAGSDQLERQSLPVLLSAIYGLERVTAADAPLGLDELTVATLRPPHAMYFAMLHGMRATLGTQRGVSSVVHSPPDGGVRGGGEACAAGDVPEPEQTLTVQVPLTFLLLMTPTRRAELLSGEDQYLFRAALQRLVAQIEPQLQSRAELEKRARALLADPATDTDGTVLTRDVEEAVVGLGDHTTHSQVQEALSSTADAQMDGVGLSAALVSPVEQQPTHTSLQECLTIMRNCAGATANSRVKLLQYLLCVVRDPASTTEDADMELVAKMLDTLMSSPKRLRLPVTEYVIASMPVPSRMSTVAHFLAHLHHPERYLARVQLSAESAAALAPDDAVALLQTRAALFGWPLRRSLVLAALGSHRYVVENPERIDSNEGHTIQGEAGQSRVPLTPAMLTVMEALVLRAEVLPGPLPMAGLLDSEPLPGVAVESEEERREWLQRLVTHVDWSGGVAHDSAGGYPNLDLAHHSRREQFLMRLALPALELYVRLLRDDVLPVACRLSDKALLNVYVRCIFSVADGGNMERTLMVLADVTGRLEKLKSRRQLVDRMIRYNGSESLGSLFRFLELIAPHAAELSVENKSLLTLLLKQNTLDPRKWNTRGGGGSAARSMSSSEVDGAGTDASGAAVAARYFACLRNGLVYALSCPSLWQTPTLREESRHRLSRWLAHYAHATAGRARPGASATEAVAAAGQQSDSSVITTGDAARSAALGSHEKSEAHAADEGVEATVDTGEGGEEEEEDDASGTDTAPVLVSSAAAAEATDAAAPAYTEDHLEEVLVLAVRAGARLPTGTVVDVANRLRERLSSLSLAPEDAAPMEAMPTVHLYVKLPHTDATEALAHAPVGLLPQPAQFIALTRGNCGFALPLSREYLHHLLTVCDALILPTVVVAFVNSTRANRSAPEPADDLEIAAIALEIFLDRAALISRGPCDESFEDALASLVRYFLSHLLHGRRTARALERLAAARARDSAASHQRADDPLADTEPDTDGVKDGVDGVCADGDGQGDVSETLRKLHERAEDILVRAVALLPAEQVKGLALTPLEDLRACFPRLSATLYAGVKDQLDTLKLSELLRLSSRYPESSEAVVRRLRNDFDLKADLDFNEYLRVARKLPARVNEVVISAHLPSIPFAACTRLLSTLASRHEALPLPLLAALLQRATDLVDTASESDRSLLLVVLQGFLAFGSTDSDVPSPCVEGEGTDTPPMLVEPQGVEELPATIGIGGAALSAAEIAERRELTVRACDRLLRVETIEDLASLQHFLRAYPSSLRSETDAAVVRRAEERVLRPLLRANVIDVRAVRQYAVEVRRHRLLFSSSTHRIKRRFFDRPEAWETACGGAQGDGSTAVGAEPPSREALLAVCVELALLLAFARPSASSAGGRARCTPLADAQAALRTVREYFSAPSEQLLILTLVTEAAGHQRRGQQHPLSTGVGGGVGDVTGGTPDAGVSGTTVSPLEQQHAELLDDLCASLLLATGELSSSQFARLVESISRLRRWEAVKARVRGGGPAMWERLDRTFADAIDRADAHSRCVVLKAVASDAELFARHEQRMVELLRSDVAVLSHEDLELVLVAALHMAPGDALEATLDAVGTRLQDGLAQCKRSTLVRLLQCHATFHVRDEALLSRVLGELEDQCCRPGSGGGEVKLDAAQVLTVLQAVSTLELALPDRFLIQCFARLERSVEQLTFPQLALACRLATELDMGYTASIHTLVSRLLESREGMRHAKLYRGVVETVCDVYDVETLPELRQQRLRHRRERERLDRYWHWRSAPAGRPLVQMVNEEA